MTVIQFKNTPVPGVEQIPVVDTHPFLEAYNPLSGSTFLIYEQVYAAAVRHDGKCTREWVLEEHTYDHKILLEGYETKEQAVAVLQARRGKHVDLIIFGDKATRIGRGVSDGSISRA